MSGMGIVGISPSYVPSSHSWIRAPSPLSTGLYFSRTSLLLPSILLVGQIVFLWPHQGHHQIGWGCRYSSLPRWPLTSLAIGSQHHGVVHAAPRPPCPVRECIMIEIESYCISISSSTLWEICLSFWFVSLFVCFSELFVCLFVCLFCSICLFAELNIWSSLFHFLKNLFYFLFIHLF